MKKKMSVDMSEYQKGMSADICEYQGATEEEEDYEEEILRSEMPGHTRQVTKRWWFNLYDKMAAVRNIQRNIKVSHLSITLQSHKPSL